MINSAINPRFGTSTYRCLAVLLGALLVLAAATSTARAEGQVELSSDGVTWQQDHSAALFDQTVQWVPGDERAESFWVRNATDEAADLRVEVRDLRGRELLRSGALELEFTLDGQPVAQGTETFGIPDTAAGRAVEVTATVRFDASAGNATQGDTLAFDLLVSLTQSTADDGPGADDSGDQEPGGLGDTGATAGLIIVLVGGALAVLAGVLVLIRGRNHRPLWERKP
ncbi:MAG: hypothetical protein ACTH2Q_09840 [Propionibacteriaceae bacterium]